MNRKGFFAFFLCTLLIFAVAIGCTTAESPAYEPVEPEIYEPAEPEPYEPEIEPDEPAAPAVPPPRDYSAYPQFHLTILHTNDWHGVLHNVPMFATLVREVRAERENVLLLDGGDIYRRGPFQEFEGAVEIAIMNAMDYHALTFGNNDFPKTDDELLHVSEHTILQLAEFPVLLANATLNGEYVAGFEPYIIVTKQGVDIAIIGVTSPKPWNRNYDFTSRYIFECAIEVAERYAEKTAEYTDIQIILSHAGLIFDQMMRGVSAIVSSDDHRVLRAPIVTFDGDRQIPIVQAGGERNHYLGQLDLYFAKIDGEWVLFDFYGRLLSVEDVEPCEEIAAIIEHYTALLTEE